MGAAPLRAAALAAQRRLLIGAWLRLQRAATWWVLAAGALAALARCAGWAVPAWAAWAVVGWLLGSAIRAWRGRPSLASALGAWDRAAGLDDALLNAWDFSRRDDAGPFARAHLALALAQLPARRAELPRVLPLRVPPLALGAPLVVLLLVGSGALAPVAGGVPLDRAARERLAAQAAEVARAAEHLPDAALDQAEKAKLEELRKRIREAQDKAREEGLGRPEALRELDQLARRAEELAALLGDTQAASPALLAELERHADTAELAAALKASDLPKAAAEADALAKQLDRQDLTLDEQRRLAQALERAAASGDRSPTGQAIASADAALQANDHRAAGASFQKLGAQLARAGERQLAGRQVGALADRLRASGGRMLATAAPGNARAMALSDLPPLRIPPSARAGQGPPPGGVARRATGSPPGGGRDAGIPVPGTAPAAGADGANGAGGEIPVPGTGMAAAGVALASIAGGSRAGNGHSDANQAPTAARAATSTSTVDAAKGDGESEQRQVAGQAHQEGSALTAAATPLGLVDAEERALDADPLPAARREQVKAYFSILRHQLEH